MFFVSKMFINYNKNYCRTFNLKYSSKAQWIKPKIKYLFLDPNNLDIDLFTSEILAKFTKDVSYSLLFRVKYIDNDGEQYGMFSHQMPFKLTGIDDNDSIYNLFIDIKELFDIFAERYRVEGVEQIQVLYIVTEEIPKLKLQNINKLFLNKEFFKITDTKTKFSSKSLPLTTNSSYFGTVLTLNTAQSYIDMINKTNNNNKYNLLDLENVISMHLYKGVYIIISLKTLDEDNIIERRVYSATTGTLYLNAFDRNIDNITFSRNIGNTTIIIRNENLISLFSKKEMTRIKSPNLEYKASSNPFIGTIDLETYVNKEGLSKVYSLGFYTKREADEKLKPNVFYLNSDLDSSKLVLDCLNEMLSSKYNGYTFYAHNLGRFDGIFILHILKAANQEKGFDYYTLKPTLKDNKLLKLEISIKIPPKIKKEDLNAKKKKKKGTKKSKTIKPVKPIKSGNYKIIIIDSYNLLSASLYDLSHAFGLSTVKGHFPHKFVSENTLNYIGNTPSFGYWQGINETYHKQLFSKNWDLKRECLKYLNKDLVSLYNIMNTFNKYIYKNYGLQVTDCLTISRLALNIYLNNYLKDSSIPIIGQSMYNDIKKAYFGGLTEVYKPYGKDLYYYDVNSLYPFAALNSMPGLDCTYVEMTKPKEYSKECFGFFYCEIETNNDYLGLLPVHNDLQLVMPNGKWKGWYFSAELNLAFENGYKINIIKGYNYNKEELVFNDYVTDLYKTKSITSGSNRAIVKSLLNNLLGRFGINIKKAISEIVDYDKLNFMLQTLKVVSVNKVTDNDFLITYYPGISKDICNAYNLDYFEIINNNNNLENDKEFKDASVAIAAAINSYARVYMSQIKLDILKNGGNIYYTDTDSLVTDKPLSSNLVGNNIGQFKLEYRIAEGYFISGKTYCLKVYEAFGEGFVMLSTVIKTKGLNSNSITYEDFINMYNNINIKGIKQNTITNYEKGSVIIGQKDVIMNHNSYKKREKVYKDNRWVNTRPLYYNNIKNTLFNQIGTNRKYGDIALNTKLCNCDKASSINSDINRKKIYDNSILNTLLYYTSKYSKHLIYFSIAICVFSIYLLSINLIDMLNDIFEIYKQEITRFNGERLKHIMENRMSYNNSSSTFTDIKWNKISKFININEGLISESLNTNNKVSLLNIISDNLNLDFKPITSVFSTPILNTQTSLVEYVFEARPKHPDLTTINPLGIQGLNNNIDQVISMVDGYMMENRQHTLELLNYQSNILYILINNLTPTIY